MKRVINIEGMSCNHCIMTVKKSLEKLNLKNLEVELGKVSFETEDDKLISTVKEMIEEEGYKVID